MSLDHILLGILHKPESGYSLKQAFDQVFNHFWAAEISQIYRHLKSLERRGFLKSWEEPSDKGPPRKLYERTPAGIAELQEWLDSGPNFADRRVPYLAQACFLYESKDGADRISFFEQLEEHFLVRLRVLEGIDAAVREEQSERFPNGLPADEICGQITLNHGLYRAHAMVAWCRDSAAILRRGEGQMPEEVRPPQDSLGPAPNRPNSPASHIDPEKIQ